MGYIYTLITYIYTHIHTYSTYYTLLLTSGASCVLAAAPLCRRTPALLLEVEVDVEVEVWGWAPVSSSSEEEAEAEDQEGR